MLSHPRAHAPSLHPPSPTKIPFHAAARPGCSHRCPHLCFHAATLDVSRGASADLNCSWDSPFCTVLCLVYPPSLLCQTPFPSSKLHLSTLPLESLCSSYFSLPRSQTLVLVSLSFFPTQLWGSKQTFITVTPGSNTELVTERDIIIFKKGRKTRGKEEVWLFVVLMGILKMDRSSNQLINKCLLNISHILGAGTTLVSKTEAGYSLALCIRKKDRWYRNDQILIMKLTNQRGEAEHLTEME